MNNQKRYAVGFAAILLAVLGIGSCLLLFASRFSSAGQAHIGETPPAFGGTLRIWLSNTISDLVSVTVSFDDKSVMMADLPGRGLLSRIMSREYGAKSVFEPAPGRHEVRVFVAGFGEVGKHEYYQSLDTTNYLYIYVTKPDSEVKRLGCRIICKTNLLGAM